MRKNNNCKLIFIVFIVCAGILVMISCKKPAINQEITSDVLRENLKYTKTSDPVKIEDLYIIPATMDYLLKEKPDVLEKHSRKDTVLSNFEEKTDLYLDKELKKYLNRKKIYSKTSIFSDVP